MSVVFTERHRSQGCSNCLHDLCPIIIHELFWPFLCLIALTLTPQPHHWKRHACARAWISSAKSMCLFLCWQCFTKTKDLKMPRRTLRMAVSITWNWGTYHGTSRSRRASVFGQRSTELTNSQIFPAAAQYILEVRYGNMDD